MVQARDASTFARPVSSAFLICDQVITETGTNKKTLVGVFSAMWVPSFPATHHKVALYYRGALEAGEHEFRIDYGARGSAVVLSKVEGVLHVQDGELPTELAANLPFLRVPSAGEYEFRLWIDGAYVQRAGFRVGLLESDQGGG